MPDQFGTAGDMTIQDRKAEVELQKTTSAAPAALKPDSQSTAASLSASRNVTRMPVNEIVVGARLRELDANKVSDIAESMGRKSEIDESKPVSKSELGQSKRASIAALVESAKFMLAHISQGEKIILTLTAVTDVKEFSRLANRVRLVLRQQG